MARTENATRSRERTTVVSPADAPNAHAAHAGPGGGHRHNATATTAAATAAAAAAVRLELSDCIRSLPVHLDLVVRLVHTSAVAKLSDLKFAVEEVVLLGLVHGHVLRGPPSSPYFLLLFFLHGPGGCACGDGRSRLCQGGPTALPWSLWD